MTANKPLPPSPPRPMDASPPSERHSRHGLLTGARSGPTARPAPTRRRLPVTITERRVPIRSLPACALSVCGCETRLPGLSSPQCSRSDLSSRRSRSVSSRHWRSLLSLSRRQLSVSSSPLGGSGTVPDTRIGEQAQSDSKRPRRAGAVTLRSRGCTRVRGYPVDGGVRIAVVVDGGAIAL